MIVLTGLSRLLRRYVENGIVRAAAPAVLGVGVLALVVLPYFRDEMVIEMLPMSANELGLRVAATTTVAPPAMAAAPVPVPVTTTAPAPPSRISSGLPR